MSKYKATINIERKIWDEFKTICHDQKTTATAEITAFITAFCLEKKIDYSEGIDWETMPVSVRSISGIIQDEVTRYIDHLLKRRLTQLTDDVQDNVLQWLNQNHPIKTDTGTDTGTDIEREESFPRETTIETDTRTDIETDIEKEKTEVSPTVADLKPSPDSESSSSARSNFDGQSIKNKTDNKTDSSKEKISGARIEKRDCNTMVTTDKNLSVRERLNRRSLSDAEVAGKEGLSTETVRRYRNAQRKPRDPSFWSRWELDSSYSRWFKKL